MHRKINVSKLSKTSSLLACAAQRYLGEWQQLSEKPDSFAVCGGCWPVRTDSGKLNTYIAVSGLEHYFDHQIIVDAVSDFLKRETQKISI